METKNQIKPLYGIIVFVISMAVLLFVAAPIQQTFGMLGLAITELILLAIGLIPIFIFKMSLKDVLPIKIPKFREIIGVIIIWVASYISILIITGFIQYFFPSMMEVSTMMLELFTSVPFPVVLLVVAVMPAICEEVLHRGFILSTFKNVKSKWIVIVIMGVIFGIFHLNIYRFLPTAILGGVLAYIMIETKNFLLPVLFHFINNLTSVSVSFMINPQLDTAPTQINSSVIGIYLILGFAVPFLFLLGSRLLHKKEVNQQRKVSKLNIIIASVTSGIMLITGLILFGLNIGSLMEPVYQENVNMEVNCETQSVELPMSIEEDGNYLVQLIVNNERGISAIEILDENNEGVYNTSAKELFINNQQTLKKGEYKVVIDFLLDDIEDYYNEMGFEFDPSLLDDVGVTGEDLYEYTDFNFDIIVRKVG